MRLIEELRREHVLIERVAGSLLTFVGTQNAPQSDADLFVAFFRRYAGELHHRQEEQVLFAALARQAELPHERGPIAAMVRDHRAMEQLLSGFERERGPQSRASLGRTYAQLLLHHMDAENSVLFPEGEERLRRVGVTELEVHAADASAQQAAALGAELIARYPPPADDGLIRGDGCALCPALGAGCDGLEREWWSDDEWEGLADRMPSD